MGISVTQECAVSILGMGNIDTSYGNCRKSINVVTSILISHLTLYVLHKWQSINVKKETKFLDYFLSGYVKINVVSYNVI